MFNQLRLISYNQLSYESAIQNRLIVNILNWDAGTRKTNEKQIQ